MTRHNMIKLQLLKHAMFEILIITQWYLRIITYKYKYFLLNLPKEFDD